MSIDDYVIRVENLGKRYQIGAELGAQCSLADRLGEMARSPLSYFRKAAFRRPRQTLWALRDISFDVRQGEIVGIIGRNGAGKSTLLKIMAQITDPSEGTAVIRGTVGSLLEVGIGFHPDLTGRENIYLYGVILGMRKAEIDRKFDEIVAFGGVEKFVDTPMKHYSSGMYVRLAFAVAAHLEPDILLIDEVLAVGDAAFQNKCLGKIESVAKGGRTVIFVSHNMPAVLSLCDRAIFLADGQLVADGPTRDVMDEYLGRLKVKTEAPLSERKDRKGDQCLRFVDCELVDDQMRPMPYALCGQDSTLALTYESVDGEPVRNVHVEVEIYGRFHESLVQVSTAFHNNDFSQIPARGQILLRLPALPLQPGAYSFDLYATANSTMADYIQDAGTIRVEPGDFFGSGKMPGATHGKFLVPHSWSVVPADRPAEVKQ